MLPICLLLLTLVLCVSGAPMDPPKEDNEIPTNHTDYDLSQFDEVYDQRQNGTENYRVNVNGVVLVWTPPGSLLTAATMLDPALFAGEYPDLDELLNNPEKPEDLFKPETTSTTSTTTTPEAASVVEPASQHLPINTKRKFRIPGFIKPFMRKHPGQF